MAITYGKNLANGVILGTVVASLYTVSTSIQRVVINHARLVNYSSTAVEVQIYVLQAGESVADAFKSNVNLILAPGETKLLQSIIGDSINTGGSVQGLAGAATSVSFSATGTEIT